MNGFYGDKYRNENIKFNGHLRDYFEFIKGEAEKEIERIESQTQIPNIQGMKKIRKRILETFFNGLNPKNNLSR